ncbi:MAG: TonB-dependent receptor [Gammaproteobacteria bacterium]
MTSEIWPNGNWRIAIWLLLPGGLFPFAAHASPAGLDTLQVTATRDARLVQDVAPAVTVVGGQEILRENPQVLAEALRGQVGTWFQQTTPGQGTPIVRGLKGSQLLNLVDGMRLNNAFFRSAPNQYLALVDPYATARLEVVRGASPSLYGSDAMGGVIQVLTEEPHLSGSRWETQSKVHAMGDYADRARVLRLQSEAGRQGLGFVGGLTWQDYGNRKTADGTVRPTGYDAQAADLKMLADIGSHSDLMLSLQYANQPDTPRIDELVVGFGEDQPSSEIYAFHPNRRLFYHARYRWEPARAWLDQLEVHLARQVINDDRRSRDFGSDITLYEDNKSTLDGLTLQADFSPAAALGLTAGAEFYADTIDSRRQASDPVAGSSAEVPSRFPDNSSLDSASVYLVADMAISSRLSLGAGARYSRFDIKLPQALDGANVRLKPDDTTGDVHAVWRWRPTVNLVANLGRGFRAPNIFDLGTLGARPGNRFNVPAEDLNPETVISADLGLKIDNADWQAELFVFSLDYDDKITSVFTGETTEDGRDIVRSVNANKVRLYGIEAGGRFDLSDRLQVYGVLNYTRGKEREPDGNHDPADRVPPLNGKLGLVYTGLRDLRLEPYLLFADDQGRLSPRDEQDPRIDPDGTPGWGTINVDLAWYPGNNLEFGLRAENLFDNSYREHGSGIDAPGMNIALRANWIF